MKSLMIGNAISTIFTSQSSSNFMELNDILVQAMMTNMDVALIDMPEILLRMKIANNHSLEELQDIFNFVMNKMASKKGPCISTAQAAQYYFPEVFSKPRDEYVAAMIKELAMQTRDDDNVGHKAISCYLGNVHVQPTLRLLNTYNSDGVHATLEGVDGPIKHGRMGALSKLHKALKPQKDKFSLDYIKLS